MGDNIIEEDLRKTQILLHAYFIMKYLLPYVIIITAQEEK